MTEKQKKKLTPRQQEILDWIRGFIQEYHMPPTVREIGRAYNMKSSSVFGHLKAIERKGYLKRGDMGARSLILLDQETESGDEELAEDFPFAEPFEYEDDSDSERTPIVGRVAAGEPILAVENIVGYVKVEAKIARPGRCFALEVTGDSMVDAGINEGDLLIVRQQPVAESGDIVVALLDEEATVKRLLIRDAEIELRPANPKYDPIMIGPDDDLRICGKVVAVKRTAH